MKQATDLIDDVVQPFQLESSHLRGRLVRLGASINKILTQHNYESPIAALLGEAVVVGAALASSLKYEGVFTLQAKGDAAVRMVVADITSQGDLRGYAQVAEGVRAMTGDARLLGNGYLAFTVDQKGNTDRYQGIVELSAGTFAEAVQHYFRQSEQIPTGIIAAVKKDSRGQWRGGCLMLQRMPREGGTEQPSTVPRPIANDTSAEDDWLRAMMLMQTCGEEELTDTELPPNELLFRLFHEEGVRVFDAHPLQHKCRCSEERVTRMLRSLPRDEIETMTVKGIVSVTCEFCNRSYLYDKAQRDKLYDQ